MDRSSPLRGYSPGLTPNTSGQASEGCRARRPPNRFRAAPYLTEFISPGRCPVRWRIVNLREDTFPRSERSLTRFHKLCVRGSIESPMQSVRYRAHRPLIWSGSRGSACEHCGGDEYLSAREPLR